MRVLKLHLTTRYYIFVKRRTVLCKRCTLCIPNLSTPSKCTSCTMLYTDTQDLIFGFFGSGSSFIFRAPKISDRSTEPFAETKRFKRSTSAPLSATLLCHASVPCFRATSGHSERLWQEHIIWSSMFYAIRLGDAEPLVTKGSGDIQEDLVLLVFDAIRSPGP